MTIAAAVGVASGMLVATPASAENCDQFLVSDDASTVTVAELDQLQVGMVLDDVNALFGGEGYVTDEYETKTGKTMEVSWDGAVTLLDLYGDEIIPEIAVTFEMEKATTTTTYQRKRVRVKNIKRAKRLHLPRFKMKTVKVVTQVPATPYEVTDFSFYDDDILRQTFVLECESDFVE